MSSTRFAAIETFLTRRPFASAVLAALLAAGFITSYLHGREAELLTAGEKLPVLIATRDLPARSLVERNAFERVAIPRRYAASDALGDAAVAGNIATRISLPKGSQLTRNNTAPLGPSTGLAMKIPAGRRAVSIAVDDVGSVAGLIRPDDTVDVLATFDFGREAGSRMMTLTLLEAVPVLAVGTDAVGGISEGSGHTTRQPGILETATPSMGEARTPRPTVTLALPLNEVQQLLFAQEGGVLSLALRPSAERDERTSPLPTTIRQIAGTEELLRSRKPAYREYRGR